MRNQKKNQTKSELRGKYDGMAFTVEDNLHIHVFWGLGAAGGDW